MPPFEHFGPDRPWWGVVGWLMPLLLVLIVAGVAVWAVARMTREHPAAVMPAPPPAGLGGPSVLAMGPDPALDRARIRYASGEIAREEYLRLSRDLGAPIGPHEEGSDG